MSEVSAWQRQWFCSAWDADLASRNHLRSFDGQLTAAGLSCAPQFIDAATFDAIVSSPAERAPLGP